MTSCSHPLATSGRRIAVFLALVWSLAPAVRAADPLPLAGHTIAIDPGHGGPDDLGSTVCAEFLDDDELLEVTPHNLRLRKKLLAEGERRRDEREKKKQAAS